MQQPFFVVWNPEHGNPQCRHAVYQDAEREAKRLANLNPGAEFFVLQTVSMAMRADPVTVERLAEIADELVPF